MPAKPSAGLKLCWRINRWIRSTRLLSHGWGAEVKRGNNRTRLAAAQGTEQAIRKCSFLAEPAIDADPEGDVMRFLPQWIASAIGDAKFDQTVDRVVRLLEPKALRAVAVHSPGMSAFEARGYIRARSAILVSHQVSAEISAGVASKHRRRLTEAVRERLIQVLLPQLVKATPAVAATLRRAA